MSHKAAKIGVTTLVLGLTFGALLYSTLGESMQYYKYVDEVVGAPETWEGKKLQVHGYVVKDSIFRKPGTNEYAFTLHRNGRTMPARFNGLPPDTFTNDAEVVLTGHLTAEGFQSTEMTAKCPSKYEEPPVTTGPGAE
jgi:cytochrome c-type biogenesis protein CcmE